MIHPHTELKFINDEVGNGIVATQFIPAGTIIWVLDKLDRAFSPEEFYAVDPIILNVLETYTFRIKNGNFLLCWDNGKFINHSFKSNCMSTAYDFEIAIKDILPGEQLTDDYGYLNITHPFRGFDEGTKRKTVYPNDLTKYYKVWDKKLLKVFHKIPKIEQALKPLVEPELWNHLVEVSEGKRQMDSILKNYCM